MSEWKETQLSELIEIIGGGTPSTKKTEYWKGQIPWLSVIDFSTVQRWVETTEKTITEKGLKNSSTKMLNVGDLIISARGTVGELAQLKIPMAFNQSCYGIRAKNATSNDYVYYLIKFNINKIKKNTHGSVFNTITRETFNQINIKYPVSKTEQNRTIKVLTGFDKKIDLLRRQNETLGAIAQALFKRWFVEFEFPDENGLPYKSSGNKMVASELGEMPEGWRVGKINELSTISTGKGLKRAEYIEKGSYPVYGANGEMGRTNSFLFDVKLIITGRVGTLGNIYIVNGKMWISDNVLILKPEENFFYFTYFAMKRINFQSLNRGSTQPLITQTDLKNYEIIIPGEKLVDQFDLFSLGLFSKIENNTGQIDHLTKIRDILLPKLMSGQIRVKEN